MKFKKFIICVAICLCINCGMKEDTEFKRMGLSFTIPKGWYLIEEDATSDESYLVWIGDKHRISDAYFQAIWLTFEKDINTLIEITTESYKETIFALVTDIDYSDTKQIDFKGNEAVMINLSMKLLNVRHVGEIICFNWEGYSFILVFIVDEKKIDKFEPDFKKIKDSLKRINNGIKKRKEVT